MKISNIKVTRIASSFWGDFASRQDELPLVTPMSRYAEYRHPLSSWFADDTMCVVEIETTTGLVGTGWCEDYCGASSAIIEGHLHRLLIGASPFDREKLWDQLYRSTMAYGQKGPALFAISAVDIALWDIAGKCADAPVFQLLGGQVRDEIQVYASHLHFKNENDFCAEAEDYVARGFRAMKMRFLHCPEEGLEGMHHNIHLVRLLRDTVGPDIEIMADAYGGWSLEYALRISRELAPFNMKWIEEPLLPDQLHEYIELTRQSPVPIAAGEHIHTRFGFAPIIEHRALDIIQFDIGRVGGFSEAVRVCAMADAAGLPVYTHAYGLPTLHLATAIRTCQMVEYFPIPVWADDSTGEGPHFDGAPPPVNGVVAIPQQKPGLGETLALAGFTPIGG
jgi:L-rhamnonate dehydratase